MGLEISSRVQFENMQIRTWMYNPAMRTLHEIPFETRAQRFPMLAVALKEVILDLEAPLWSEVGGRLLKAIKRWWESLDRRRSI